MIRETLVAGLFLSVMANAQPHEGHWNAPAQAAARQNPTPPGAESVKRGARLYRFNCATCHGREGRGDGRKAKRLETPPSDLTATAVDQTDGELAWKIATGRGEMPAWGEDFTDAEMWDLVNFIKEALAGSQHRDR